MAYASDETGEHKIYMNSFPDANQRLVLSDGEGFGPIWSEDGNSLFYISDNSVVRISMENSRPVGREVVMTVDREYQTADSHRSYDVRDNGAEFLFIEEPGADVLQSTEVNVITGFDTMVAELDPENRE